LARIARCGSRIIRTGGMERWNSGTMGPVKRDFPFFAFCNIPILHYSNIPIFPENDAY
jgi:hypothetical protein